MYHVTNDRSEAHPRWDMVKVTIPNDALYNGNLLVGLPVAFFTTTLIHSALPKTSPYPRGATPGVEHWRVTIPFNHHKFKLFIMNEHQGDKGTKQVHLLCLNKQNPSKAEKLLTTALTHMEKLIDDTKLQQYFPDGKANEFTQSRMFVNVSFINPVSITGEASWEKIPKADMGYGNIIDPPFRNLYEWGLHKLKLLQEEWETLQKEGKLKHDTPINTVDCQV